MTAALREHISGSARATRLASSLSAGATSLTVEAGGLATWPDGSVGRIPLVIDAGLASEEHLYATGRSGDALTGLVRGQEGTLDQPHAGNAPVVHGLHASHIDRPNELLSLPQAKGDLLVAAGPDDWRRQAAGADGTVLIFDSAEANGVRASATLAGITLTTPAIANFVNAQHDHLDADDGGLLTQAATHQAADTDTAPTALHHTLGASANQAAPGNHAHDYSPSGHTHPVTAEGIWIGPSQPSQWTTSVAVTANMAYFVLVRMLETLDVNTLSVCLATLAGNVDIGVYAADGGAGGPGTRLVSSGSVAPSGANGNRRDISITPTTLTAGTKYWFAFASNNAGTAPLYGGAPTHPQNWFALNQASAFPLPATAAASTASPLATSMAVGILR